MYQYDNIFYTVSRFVVCSIFPCICSAYHSLQLGLKERTVTPNFSIIHLQIREPAELEVVYAAIRLTTIRIIG